MKGILKTGWSLACKHPGLVLLGYLYSFVWGFFLYKYWHAIVASLLVRYPGESLSHVDTRLFWLEFHFQLTKTDLIMPYVWTFCIVLLLRMLVTPLIHAGVYYTFYQTGQVMHSRAHVQAREKRVFLTGVNRYGKIFSMYYLLRIILSIAPLYFLYPHWMQKLEGQADWSSYFQEIGLSLSLYILYVLSLSVLFMYNQLRLLSGIRLLQGGVMLIQLLHRLLPLSLILLTAMIFIWGASHFISWVMAGFMALILYQCFHLVRVLFRFWEIGSHYSLWIQKIEK
ncbi:hypothetical protein [Marinicrinis sediminis]|uniref:DUF418 domain-containing protein n=1 Tax=Marinicrinis sediminis TaxID=1652465 RepID=A0ABW5RER3_9BACL